VKDLTTGKPAWLIFNFAMPMLLGNIFQQSYNIVDTIIVGNFLGKEALAAVGASFPIIFTLISLIIGVASGGTIVIAQYFGARDLENVRKTIQTLYIFLFITAVILTVVGLFFTESVLRFIRLPEEVMPDATLYLTIYMTGLVGFFGFNGTSAILSGLGDSKTPLYFLMISTVFNIGLDLLFILVFKWGIAGAATATVISQGGAFLTAMMYLNRYHRIISFRFREYRFYNDIFRQTVRIGLPTGIQHTFVSLGLMALMTIVNTFGTDVIAGYSVAGRIDSLVTLPAMNFSAALATYVGQNLGARKIERVRAGLMATILMSIFISVVLTLVVIFFKNYLIRLFTDDPEVIRIGAEYLVIVSTSYLIITLMFKLNGVLRGAGATLIPMFITLCSIWVIRIPLAWFFSDRIGETGIWWSIPAGWTAGLVLTWIYYLSGRWKSKVIIREVPV
jgi:putative MATE family efflux protein